jgi:hypothetical protein
LNSGSVDILLDGGQAGDAENLVLSGSLLEKFQSANALSISSYSSIKFHGAGNFGGGIGLLGLHAAAITGDSSSGEGIEVSARTIILDNDRNASSDATSDGDGI